MPITDYLLVREISKGGFGTVHLGTRRRDGIQVALKLLHLPNDANLRRFYREAKVLHQQLDNPHVVDLLGWDFDVEPAFIAMEYCSGGSLRRWAGSKPDWRRVCLAMSQVAVGLKGIHAAGGFHRDIKPDNLLVAESPGRRLVVKVGDFGLARSPALASSGPMTRTARGTDGYIAPELQLGRPFDQRCDVYSLGITAIELLTGSRVPKSLELRSDLPTELQQFLRSLVNFEPRARPSIGECVRVFEAYGEMSSAKRNPVTAKKGAKRSGVGKLLAGLALLFSGVALATMNSKDANGSFHGRDGRFRSGRWG